MVVNARRMRNGSPAKPVKLTGFLPDSNAVGLRREIDIEYLMVTIRIVTVRMLSIRIETIRA